MQYLGLPHISLIKIFYHFHLFFFSLILLNWKLVFSTLNLNHQEQLHQVKYPILIPDYLSLLSIIHVLVCYRFPTKHLDKIRVIRHLSIPPTCFQLGNPKSILESSSQGRKILHPNTCPSRCWPKSLATETSNFFDLIDFTCKSFQQ